MTIAVAIVLAALLLTGAGRRFLGWTTVVGLAVVVVAFVALMFIG